MKPIDALFAAAKMECVRCDKPAGTCDCWEKCECGITKQRGGECRNQTWHIAKAFSEELAVLIVDDMAQSYKLFQREHMAARLTRAVMRHAQPIIRNTFEGVESAIAEHKAKAVDNGDGGGATE